MRQANVYDPSCASRVLFDAVTARWSALVLGRLVDGPARWSELRRAVGGISEKMLGQTLRSLERIGLVERSVEPSRPPRVTYELTPLGQDLAPRVVTLATWIEDNVAELEAARAAFDLARTTPRV